MEYKKQGTFNKRNNFFRRPVEKKDFTYLVFNKPFGVLSQFTNKEGRPTLKDYIPVKRIYPVGRLDSDSEGLMILTDDGRFNQWLTNPNNKQPKTYLAQVEGIPNDEQLEMLKKGVIIEGQRTLPAKVAVIDEPKLWERIKPIRFRKTVPTSWIEITVREGRNRQVRRMTAAVGLPCVRLVRTAIANILLGSLASGKYSFIKRPVL